jgi:hypothetical protein
MRNKVIWLSVFVLGFMFSSALKAEDAAKEFKGTAGCAMCTFGKDTKATKCAAALKVGNVVYMLKAADKADAATKDAIEKAKGVKEGKDMSVMGVEKDEGAIKYIVVQSIKAPAAPAAATK